MQIQKKKYLDIFKKLRKLLFRNWSTRIYLIDKTLLYANRYYADTHNRQITLPHITANRYNANTIIKLPTDKTLSIYT